MVLPKAPAAGAAAAPAQPMCGMCGEAALETEGDLVEVFCNTSDCIDSPGRRYHRECMREHIDKTGRVRKTHGGATDMRQIARMELTGFHCVHSHREENPCRGRIKGSLVILQVKKKPPRVPAAEAAPKTAAAKLPSLQALTRKAPRNTLCGAGGASRLRAAAQHTEAAGAAHHPAEPEQRRRELPVGADFADVDAENRRRAAKAARAVAKQNAKAAAAPLGDRNGVSQASPISSAGAKSPWWEQIQRLDDSYEPKGFNNLTVPSGFSMPAPNPWAAASAGGADNGAAPHGGPSNGGPAHGSHAHDGEGAQPLLLGGALSDAELAHLYTGPVQVPDGRDPDALFAQLLEMGYSEEDSHEVAFRCSTIEAAVEAINNKTDPEYLAQLKDEYQAAVAAQAVQAAHAAQARAGALPPPQSAASLAADAAAAAALHAADVASSRGQPAGDGWVTVAARARKPAGSVGSAGSGAKAGGPLTLPKDAGAVLMGLYRSKKLRLADVPLPVLSALAHAPDGVAYECLRSLEDSLRRGNTIRHPASWLLNAMRTLTEQYRMCSLSDSDDDDDGWSDSGSRSGSSPAGSSFGGSYSSSSWAGGGGVRQQMRHPAAPAQQAWQQPRAAQPVQHAPATSHYAAYATSTPPPPPPPAAVEASRWAAAEAPATPDLLSYLQIPSPTPSPTQAFTPSPAVNVQLPPPPAPVYAAAYTAPQPATAEDDDLAFILNQLDVR